ncbi:MAG: ATP-binding protein [Actinomycetota bacterium]|nr:ATP-binding protein [Actinomycetota bacterium]
MIEPVIVVTGLPGSGKTTLGRQLSASLGLPLLSLDSVKEAIVDRLDVADRFAVRAAAREVLARIIPDCPHGCLIDIWVNPVRDHGEVRDALRGLGEARFAEIVCTVPAELAIERYADRPRHQAHLPADQGTIDRIREAAPMIGPLGLGPARAVDTSQEVDLESLVAWLRSVEQEGEAPDMS